MTTSKSGMRYKSTRASKADSSSYLSFCSAVLQGLAPDGGLYVPEHIPVVSESDDSVIKRIFAEDIGEKEMPFDELAVSLMRYFVPEEDIPLEDLKNLSKKSFSTFNHEEVVPLIEVNSRDNVFVLELFHGPTFAFKDVALQFLGNLFGYMLEQKHPDAGKSITVIGATSGDTGSAAIYGLRGKPNIEVYILHPKGKVADIQERQMTTVLDENVHNIAVSGTFDDCQSIVKELFRDAEFKKKHGLGAVNSINWARILAQIVYYFYAYFQYRQRYGGKKGDQVVFSVPTGNFGDVLAGYYAKRMGLPISQLIIATNDNDILTRFFRDGDYSKKAVKETLAPAMDIMYASNFERYLYHLCNEDDTILSRWMLELADSGKITVPHDLLAAARVDFWSDNANQDAIIDVIKEYEDECNYLACPHTACGLHAAKSYRGLKINSELPILCLATAHPAKFANAIEMAVSHGPQYPKALSDLRTKEKRVYYCAPDASQVRSFVELVDKTTWKV